MKTDNVSVLSPDESVYTPKQALLQLLEMADDLENVIVAYTMKETRTTHICSTDCEARDLAFVGAILTQKALEQSQGNS